MSDLTQPGDTVVRVPGLGWLGANHLGTPICGEQTVVIHTPPIPFREWVKGCPPPWKTR